MISSPVISKVLKRVEELKSELISLTSSLVKFQTISPPSNTLECAEYIRSYFESCGMKVSFYAKEKGKVNIHVRVPGESGKTIIWLGHLDVVPAGMRERWIHDPFGGIIEDGRVYGRGTSDMKGSCAAAMIAAKILNEVGERDRTTIDFWFTCDEEVGSPDGTRWLIEENLIRGDACLIGDSLSKNPSLDPYIDVGCKGYVRLRLKATGKTAHASMPFHGDNAIDKVLSAIDRLKRISDYRLNIPTDLENLIESSIEYLLIDEALTSEQREAVKRSFHYPIVSLTMISGGIKINVIPDYAEASFDIRVTPGISLEEVIEKICKLNEEFKAKGIEAEIINLESGYYEQWDSDFALSLRKAIEISTDFKPKPKILLGATDAVPVKRALGIPCLGFGAGIEKLAHAPNEYVTIDGLLSAAKVYAVLPFLF
ncbi:MAG: M20 family metallopeptidase [Candidatus Bathyarchaeia archaeon]